MINCLYVTQFKNFAKIESDVLQNKTIFNLLLANFRELILMKIL